MDFMRAIHFKFVDRSAQMEIQATQNFNQDSIKKILNFPYAIL